MFLKQGKTGENGCKISETNCYNVREDGSMDNLQLSRNFSFYELTGSEDFPDLVEENRIQASEETILNNLRHLANDLLQPVRDFWGKPIIVLSGFRSERLNQEVGGSINSQHKRGEACDFTTSSWKPELLCDFIMESKLLWHQLILYKKRKFIHISLGTGEKDGQFIIKG